MATACASYLAGTAPEWDALFANGDGEPCNPTTVTATLRKPDGTIVSATVTNEALGEYHVEAPALADAGTWIGKVVGLGGGCGGAIEWTFTIRASHVV